MGVIETPTTKIISPIVNETMIGTFGTRAIVKENTSATTPYDYAHIS